MLPERLQGRSVCCLSPRLVGAAEATPPGCWRAGAPRGGGAVGERGSTALSSDAARVAAGLPVRTQAACATMCVFPFPGRMFIFYGNKTSTQFLNFTPTLICSDGLQADILGSVSPTPETGSHWGFRGGFEEGVFFFKSDQRVFLGAAVSSADLRTVERCLLT